MRRKLLLLGLAAFLSVGAAHALTLSELQTQVRRAVRDTASSTTLQRYSDAVLTGYLNEAQRDVINGTWAISKSTNISVLSGTTYYTLPTDVAAIYRVYLQVSGDTSAGNLPEITQFQLDDDARNTTWTLETEVPRYFFQDKAQSNKIGLKPFPNVAGTLTIQYYAYATDLASASDEPFLGDDRLVGYHDLLVYFCAYRILLMENMLDRAKAFRDLYDAGIARMNANVGVKPPPVPNVATAGGHGQ